MALTDKQGETMDLIDDVIIISKEKTVGFAIVYCEADDSWYTTCKSTAPSEEFIGRNRSNIEHALYDLLDHVEKL